MREIKFRVWDENLKVMLTPERNSVIKDLWRIGNTYGGVITYPNGILMQSTGLKDKNGVEIFEGDILKHYLYERVYQVYWNQNGCGWSLTNNFGHYMALGGMCVPNLEIIGNIHENEDLLPLAKNGVEKG